jgi:hypothetical protein
MICNYNLDHKSLVEYGAKGKPKQNKDINLGV